MKYELNHLYYNLMNPHVYLAKPIESYSKKKKKKAT